MSKISLKTIVLGVAALFVVLALASALPGSNAVSTSKDVPNAISYTNSFVKSQIHDIGQVTSTLFLANNTLLNGNVRSNESGMGIQSVTYDPMNNELYVATLNTVGRGSLSTIYILNATTGKVIGTLLAGMATQSFTVDPSNGHVYVINRDSDNVSIINGSSNKVTGSINVGYYPVYSVYDASNGNLYVSNSFNNNVSIIDTSTNTVIGSVTVGISPNGLAYDSANGNIYVANIGGSNVTVINGSTNKVIDSVTTGSYPSEAAYDPINGYIYVTNNGGSNVTVINGTNDAVVGSITVGSYPYAIAFDPSNDNLYITNAFSSNVSVVASNNGTVISNIPVGYDPESVAINALGGYAYVGNLNSGNFGGISIIKSSTNTLLKTVYTIAAPTSLASVPANGNLYVTDNYPSDVSVINTTTSHVADIINTGNPSMSTLYDPQDGNVYTLNYVNNGYSGNITVINGTTGKTTGSISISNPPMGMAFDPSNGYIYVTAYYYQTSYLYTINASSGAIVKQSSYYSPYGSYGEPVYNPQNGDIYVYNSTSFKFLIINSSTNSVGSTSFVYPYPNSVTFDPLNGYLYLTNSQENNVTVLNATTNAILGSVNVGGNPISGVFDPLNGYIYIANENSDNISVINGATNTNLGNLSVGYGPDALIYSPSNGNIYVSNYVSGSVSVIQTAYYSVTFTQSGLPSGSTWYVNLSNGQKYSSSSSTLSFPEYNGTFSYALSTSDKTFTPASSSGSFTVNGGKVSEKASFTEVVYNVNFKESGLPAGTTWYLNLSNGVDFVSHNSTVTFSESNGTYSYSLSTVKRTYDLTTRAGTFTVDGLNLTESATFKEVTYVVKISETGLPNGTTWYVNLSDGGTFSSSNSTVEFLEPNGTYSYSVSGETGYTASHSNGTVSVNGSNTSEEVNFTSPANPSSTTLYIIIGGVVIIGIAGAAFVLIRRIK